jgi:hypothetical protein
MTQEVEFETTERALLDWLQQRARPDGALAISDTKLIEVLQLSGNEQAFFAAKMRLVTAGVISLYVDGAGHQIIQLNMPERKDSKSSRYVFTIVPLELIRPIRKQVKEFRLKAKERKPIEAAAPVAVTGVPARPGVPGPSAPPPLSAKRQVDFAKAQKIGQQRLGVRPAPPPEKKWEPLRPPLLKKSV